MVKFSGTLSIILTVVLTMSGVTSKLNDINGLSALREGLSQVSSSFYKAVATNDQPGNLVCSPLSMAVVMGMIQVGAMGNTAQEIKTALKFPSKNEDLLEGLSALQQAIGGLDSDKAGPVALANSAFLQLGYNFKSDFKRTLEDYLKASPKTVNFGDSVSAANTINSWVKEQSRNKIQRLFEEDSFSSDDRAVLVSVVHFKGDWKQKFPADQTEKKPFFTSESNSIQVDTMKLNGAKLSFGKVPELDSTALQLPFTAGNLSMLLILPDKRSGLAELESKIMKSSISRVGTYLRPQKVDVSLPKFKVESYLDLEKALKAMGINDLFDADRADLSGVFETSVPHLHVSKVIQKVVVEINEEGAEAAAATGAGIRSRRAAEPPAEFVADHPFLFAIVHSASESISESESAILFLGKVLNPAGSSSSPRDEL